MINRREFKLFYQQQNEKILAVFWTYQVLWTFLQNIIGNVIDDNIAGQCDTLGTIKSATVAFFF